MLAHSDFGANIRSDSRSTTRTQELIIGSVAADVRYGFTTTYIYPAADLSRSFCRSGWTDISSSVKPSTHDQPCKIG